MIPLALAAVSCTSTRPLVNFQQELALSQGPGIIISNVPPLTADRASGGISAVATLFSFWKTPALPEKAERHLAASMNQLMIPPEEVMVDLADRRMLWSFSFYATMDDVETRLLAGIPVLAMVQDRPDDPASRRYVVIFGFIRDRGLLAVREGSSRTTTYTYTDFKRIWRPVRNWCMVVCPPDRITWELNARERAARALFHERIGQWRTALDDLERLQAEDPDNVNIMLARARVHLRAKEPGTAEELYRRALEIDPLNARAANNLAFFMQANRLDLVEAERWSRRALSIEPSNPHYLDTLGAILLARRQPAEAAAVLEKARFRYGNLPASSRREIDLRLIRAFTASGQTHLARQVWADILREDPACAVPEDLKGVLP